MRIAWFTPLSSKVELDRGGASCVSEYTTRTILPRFSAKFEIDVYTDSERVEDTAAHFGLPNSIFHFLSAFQRHKNCPYDIFFYQIEDSPLSSFIRSHVGLMPGVVWLHDLLFQNLSAEALSISPWEQTLRDFAGVTPMVPEVPGPVGYREAYLSAVPIFSNPWAHSEFRRLCYETMADRYGMFPSSYHLPVPVNSVERKPVDGQLRIAFCGSIFIEDRAHKILAALAELKQPYELTWMIDSTVKARAEELSEEFGLTGINFIVGRSPEQWEKIISSADITVHTHYSVYGNVDPYLSISIGGGVPSLVSDFGTTGYYPEECIVPIVPGSTETAQIVKALQLLAKNRTRTSGAEFVQNERDPTTVGTELESLLTATAPTMKQILGDWAEFQTATKKIVLDKLRTKNQGIIPLQRSFNDLGWEAL